MLEGWLADPQNADFLIGLIAAIAAGVSAAVAAIGVQTVLGVLLNVGLTLMQYLMRKGDKPDDVQQVIRTSIGERREFLGRGAIGGQSLLIETRKGLIHHVQYLCEGPADFTGAEFYVDGRSAVPGPDNWVKNGYLKNNLRLEYRSGGDETGTPYEELISKLAPYVTRAYRGDGMSTVYLQGKSVKAKHSGTVWPAGIPSARVVANYGACYDPRTAQTAFTQNLVLHLLRYLTSPDGCKIPMAALDLAGDWSRCATIADEIMATRDGGTVRRYHGATTWRLTEKRGDVIRRLLLPIAGRIYLKPSGLIGLRVGQWTAPTVHIRDHQIIEANLRKGPLTQIESREVVVKFTSPAARYTETTSRPWVVDEITGSERRTEEAYGIQSHHHARRIAKILGAKLNPEWQGTLRTTLAGLEAWDEERILADVDDFAIVAHPFEVLGIALERSEGAARSVVMKVQSADAASFDFDAETEEGDPIVIPVEIGEKDPVDPSGVVVTATMEAAGGRIVMTCATPLRPGEDKSDGTIDTEWLWSEAGAEVWHTLGIGESTSAEVTGIQSSGPWDVKVRHYGANGVASNDVIVEDVTAAESQQVPPPPTAVTVALSASAVGAVDVTFRTPSNAERFAGVQIWRSKDGSALTLVDTYYRGVAGTYTVTDTPPSTGTWYYYAQSIAWSGKRSDRVSAGGNPISV